MIEVIKYYLVFVVFLKDSGTKLVDLLTEVYYNYTWVSKMIISTKELLVKYNNYKVPKMKIKREIEEGKYIELKRGLYETDANADPMLLAGYLCSPSYLSFEYVLSTYGLIPETAYTYTSATLNKRHTYSYKNKFGNYSYRDIPNSAFPYGISHKVENGYSYVIASREKALCDLLYTMPSVNSVKRIKQLLFDNLRIDEIEFKNLDMDDLIFLCDLYKNKNLYFLKKYITGGAVNG